MPVYNSADFLNEAIESIFSQSYSNFELNIVYDQSSDNSLEIINQYVQQDQRLNLFEGKGEGISSALNIGIENSKGKYIARMDADDICDTSRLENQVRFLENFKLDICGGHCILIDELGRVNGLSISPLDQVGCTLSLGFEVPFFHPSVVYRRNFLLENNLRYGQSIYKAAEDYDLWVRMHDAGARFGNVDAIVLKYRVLDNSLSRNNKPMLKASKVLANKFFNTHYKDCIKKLESIAKAGNLAEQSLVIRFILRSFIKRGNFSTLRYLKYMGKKTIFLTTLSEIVRTIRFKG